MTLANGDLTTPQLAANWLGTGVDPASPILAQLISSMSRSLLNKLNRARIYSQLYTRTLDGVGNYQLMLPDYPVTSIVSIQLGAVAVPASPLPALPASTGMGYGYRFIPWKGELPGSPAIVEFSRGLWNVGAQNIIASYNAGYLISAEAGQVPSISAFTVTVQQPQGIWCRDNGVSYASNGATLVPVAAAPAVGQYVPPPDTMPGLYTFAAADAGAALLFNYSYVPSDLEEACNQMVAERLSYRDRIGVISKSLGGQETMRWMRGGNRTQLWPDLPPEVESLILPYFNVTPPGDLGAPL